MLSFECGNRLCGKTRHPKKWASTRGSLAGFEHFPAFVKKRCLFGTTVYSWKFHPHLGLWKRQGQQDPNVVFFLNGVKFIVKWLCVGGLVSCLGQGTTSTDLPESIAHVVNGTDCFVPHLNLRNVKFFFFWFSATTTLESYQWFLLYPLFIDNLFCLPSTVQGPVVCGSFHRWRAPDIGRNTSRPWSHHGEVPEWHRPGWFGVGNLGW